MWYLICVYFVGAERPKLDELYEKFTPHFASFWKDIGIFLKIPYEELKVIDKDFSGKCRECCNHMLDTWLETTPSASWSKIAAAVDSAINPQCKAISAYTMHIHNPPH